MARSRNIKPGLLQNEILGVADPLYTLGFQGLWLVADREGRLEDRPLRIRAQTFPYRAVDMNALLDWLHANGFILRYQVGEKRFIQVLNFGKHQNPHKNETESVIPAPDEIESTPEKIGTRSEEVGSTPADSLSTDSLSTDAPEKFMASKTEPSGFAECWNAYPKRSGGNSRKEAEKAYRARLKAGVSPTDLLDGVQRYAAYIRANEKEGTAYVKQASTFFGTGEHWREPWVLPGSSLPSADWRQDPAFRGCV
jgi:hypothetical protein